MCISEQSKMDREIFPESGQWFCNLLRCFVVFLHWLFDQFVTFIFAWCYSGKSRKVPPVTNDLLLESGVSLAKKIRNKEVKSETVVSAFIERCKEVNPIINAIVEEQYERALKEARQVDKSIESGLSAEEFKAKPFLGVPFTTKESNRAKGFLHTMGLVARRNYRSDEDAVAVGFMRNAGGILIATTNVPEVNLWTETRNNVYGQTNNPYDTTRSVGGSSGGEAAIVASCGSPLSVSSDIGGSIRMPAFFNGVFGHKPSGGLTSLEGIGLRQDDYYDSMAAVGPICKKAEDLEPMLRVIIGNRVSLLKLDTPVDLKNLQIFYQETSQDLRSSRVDGEMRSTLDKVVNHFHDITGSSQKVQLAGTRYSYRLWRYWMSQECDDFKHNIKNGKSRANAVAEICNMLKGTSEITLAALLKLIDEDFFPKEDEKWARRVTAELQKNIVDMLGDNGVLFYPSSPFPASYHYTAYLRPYNFGYWCIFNVLKLPTCQIPLGLSKDGLPLGIQVVAGPWNDHLCLAVAKEVERKFGGWVAPS